MLSIGIDVSKGKSTVCGMKPGGEIVYTPFEVQHTREGMFDHPMYLIALCAGLFLILLLLLLYVQSVKSRNRQHGDRRRACRGARKG